MTGVSDDVSGPIVLGASGFVDFRGTPCPGQSCAVSPAFLVNVDDLDLTVDCGVFGAFFSDCQDVHLTETVLVGGATPDALVLDPTGLGAIPDHAMSVLGLAKQNGVPTARKAPNPATVPAAVDWMLRRCAVQTSFTVTQEHLAPLDLTVEMVGDLVNQPPIANAGPDAVAECTSPGGATVTLSGAGSSDVDGATSTGNISWYVWRAGALFSDAVISASADPVAHVQQPLNATRTYFLRVLDRFFQNSADTVTVQVVDSTPPVIDVLSLTRACLWPANHKYVRYQLGREIVAHATDTCDPSPSVAIQSVTSSQPDDALGGGDGATTHDVLFGPSGFCVRAERAGNEGRDYAVTIAATDASGNTSTKQVTVQVAARASDCPGIPESAFVSDQEAASACAFP